MFLFVVLALMTGTNFILSYAPWDYSAKLWLVFGGLIVPLLFWAQRAKGPGKGESPFFFREFLGPLSPALGIGLLCLMVFLRFWRIETLSLWPGGDEAIYGLASRELSRKWDWIFFHTEGQSPPALIWIDSLFCRFSQDPFFCLWVPSALVSTALVVLGFFAARRAFSRSFAWLFGGILAFSYWPLYLGRICHSGITLPLAEFVFLLALGYLWKAEGRAKDLWALAAGFACGALSWTFVPWPVVSLAGSLLLFRLLGSGRVRALFLAGMGAGLVPFLLGVFRQGYGQHIGSVAAWNGPWDWHHRILILLDYWNVLGWGVIDKGGFYIPPQGGFLNPVLTAFFLLGLVQVFLWRRHPFVLWLCASTVLFLLPGVLSMNVEGFRIVQVLPLLVLVTAWGFQPLLEALPGRKGVFCVLAIVLFSAWFDLGRLAAPYREEKVQTSAFLPGEKSPARYRAYREIDRIRRQEGPGWVFCEWDPRADRSLELACYSFNLARNKDLDPSGVRWLALVVDGRYRPFLERRFREARWQDLSQDGGKELQLMVLPLDRGTAPVFERWAKADPAFQDLNRAVEHFHDQDCLEVLGRGMKEHYPMVKGDPFLESCYWEKLGYFYYNISGHYPEHLRAIQRALEKGYPAAHLYRQLGELYRVAGRVKESREAMGRAERSAKEFPLK